MGCRSNQAESTQIESDILNLGHELVNSPNVADIVVINSCTVTAKADAQCRRMISKALKLGQRVIVTGCSAEINKETLLKTFPSIELFGNSDKHSIIKEIRQLSKNLNYIVPAPYRHRPIVKIQDGCDNFCSYCIVPYARGRSRSRPVQDIINEVVNLEQFGFNEIVLSGIHLGMYGKDIHETIDLAVLLRELLLRTRIPRIRLSSLEVNEINDEILEVISEKRICNHFHLPLQSGCNEILIAMNRHYTALDYKTAVQTLTMRIPDVCIGADVMVGFPGEMDASFAETEALIDQLPLSYLHVFSYSRRDGTPAAKMTGQIPENIKKMRSERLRHAGTLKRRAFISSQIGKTKPVLVESIHQTKHYATTRNFIKTVFQSTERYALGSLATVTLDKADHNFAAAHLVNVE